MLLFCCCFSVKSFKKNVYNPFPVQVGDANEKYEGVEIPNISPFKVYYKRDQILIKNNLYLQTKRHELY